MTTGDYEVLLDKVNENLIEAAKHASNDLEKKMIDEYIKVNRYFTKLIYKDRYLKAQSTFRQVLWKGICNFFLLKSNVRIRDKYSLMFFSGMAIRIRNPPVFHKLSGILNPQFQCRIPRIRSQDVGF